jgi:hypothetical protein
MIAIKTEDPTTENAGILNQFGEIFKDTEAILKSDALLIPSDPTNISIRPPPQITNQMHFPHGPNNNANGKEIQAIRPMILGAR